MNKVRHLTALVAVGLGLAVTNVAFAGYPGNTPMPADVDFDWMYATIQEFKASDAQGLPWDFYMNSDNDGNGIYDADNTAMLSAILMRGKAGYTGIQYLDQSMCSQMQTDFNLNRQMIYDDFEIRDSTASAILGALGYPKNAVDIVTQLVSAELGGVLLDLLGGWATIADTGMLSGNNGGFMNVLFDGIVEYFFSDLGYSQYSHYVTDDVNFEASKYYCWGNANNNRANRLGAAGDVDYNVTSPLVNYGNNGNVFSNYGVWPNNTRESFLQHCNITPPLRISTHPTGGTFESGDSHTFSTAVVGGQGDKRYRWCWMDSTDDPLINIQATHGYTSSTTDTFQIGYLTNANADHRFVVVVNDTIWKRTSSGADMTVNNVGFTWRQQPAAASKYVDESQTFSVGVHGGSAVPSIYFEKGPGSGGPFTQVRAWQSWPATTYTINPLNTSHIGYYRAQATDGTTTLVSNAVLLNVTARNPHIDIDPVGNLDLYSGGAYSMSVTVSGATPPYTYSWQKYNGSSWATVWTDGPKAATSSTYNMGTLTAAQSGQYRCHVAESGPYLGSADSATATVQIDNMIGIGTQPAGGLFYVGDNVQPTVVTTGGKTPLTYQWKKGPVGGTPSTVTGGNSATLNLSNIQLASEGSYNCTITDRLSHAITTSTINIYVYPAVTITGQPASFSGYVGANHTLTATVVGGKGSLHYQWYKDAVLMTGMTTNTVALTGVAVADSGTYTCNITDDGTANKTTTPAVVTIAPYISIVSPPVGGNAYVDGSHTFNVDAAGGWGTRHYQWYQNGTPLAGKTSPSFTLSNLTVAQAGSYYCHIYDDLTDTEDTVPVDLVIWQALRATTQPTGGNYYAGAGHAFNIIATGGMGSIHYQWYRNTGGGFLPVANEAGHISGATAATMTMTNLQTTDAGQYYCNLTDDGTANSNSNTVQLSVASHMWISTHPVGANLGAGQDYSLSIVVGGGLLPIQYQWRLDTGTGPQDIIGATGATLALTNVGLSNAGTYSCSVRDAKTDAAVSEDAVVSVLAITGQPVGGSYDLSVAPPTGYSHTFYVTAAGGNCASYSYQWYFEGTPLTDTPVAPWKYYGTHAEAFKIFELEALDSGDYYVEVTCGSVTVQSNTAYLGVAQDPIQFTVQPVGGSFYVGSSTTLTVEIDPAHGTAPFTYQWKKAGVPIDGATSTSYTLSSLQLTDAGSYTCSVTDSSTPIQTATTTAGVIQVFSPLAVATHPVGGNYYAGDGLSHLFTVSVTGGMGALTLQWQKRSGASYNNIPLATGASYEIDNLIVADAGTYRCLVSDAGPGADVGSNDAVLSVRDHLAITGQPTGGTFYVGDTHFTYAWVSGGILGPGNQLKYQWYKDGAPMGGGTNPLYQSAFLYFQAPQSQPLQASDSATYVCVVTDYGTDSVDSSGAVIDVKEHTVIITQPVGGSQYVGDSFSLHCLATNGKPPLHYQWRKDGVAMPAETNDTLSFASLTLADGADYTCFVYDSDPVDPHTDPSTPGNALSDVATLSVADHLSIQSQPDPNYDRYVGQNFTLSVATAGGMGAIHYQWQKNGEDILGATDASLMFASLVLGDASTYTCSVWDDNSDVTATSPSLLRVADAMVISTQPLAASRYVSTSYTFNVGVDGGMGTLLYQWYRNGVAWAGGTNPTLTLNPLTLTHNANWYCVITDDITSVQTNTVALNVVYPLYVVAHPSDKHIVAGQSAVLMVQPGGGITPITYQWYRNGAIIGGATNQTYIITNASVLENAGSYYCIVKDSGPGPGVVTSNSATVTVLGIGAQPFSTATIVDGTASFTCEGAGGTGGAFAYQWYKDDGAKVYQPILGATSNTYTISPAALSDAGDYRCTVTEGGLTVTSASAHLSVIEVPPPVVETPPADADVYAGETVTLSVVVEAASGTPFEPPADAYTYRWQFNNGSGYVDIPGATSASWTSPVLAVSDTGHYRCWVGDQNVEIPSDSALVTVWALISIVEDPTGGEYYAGGSASLTMEATGGRGQLYYQWKHGAVDVANEAGHISGANAVMLTLSNLLISDAGDYTCVVTDAFTSTATTAAATISVAGALTAAVPNYSKYIGDDFEMAANVVGGYAPYTYQWKKGGSTLPGETGATLAFTGLTAGDAGSYSCSVHDKYLGVESTAGTLTVGTRIHINTQPASANLVQGETYTAFVSATGGYGSIHYQWKKDGQVLVGKTAPALSISYVTDATAGSYTCVLTDDNTDSLTTDASVLTVLGIAAQPEGANKQAGEEYTFYVFTQGGSGAPVAYQWLKDGNPLVDEVDHVAGALTNSLVLTNLVSTDTGAYRCRITQTGSTALLSDAANLNVGGNPPIIQSITPLAQNAYVGANATFDVVVQAGTGVGPLQYQWQFNSGNGFASISGATDATLTLTTLATTKTGSYRCVVTDSDTPARQTRSASATLGVYYHLVVTSPDLQSATYAVGATPTPLVYETTGGLAGVQYQWRKDGQPIAGATTSSYGFDAKAGIDFTDAGSYTCYVHDHGGDEFTSNAAIITVTGPLTVLTNPASAAVTEGEPMTMSVSVAGGTAPYQYQWYGPSGALTNGGRITGATSSMLAISPTIGADDGGYYCVITDSVLATAQSATATLSVHIRVWIDVQPEGDSVRAGTSYTFSVHATAGTLPYQYSWLRSYDGLLWEAAPGAGNAPEYVINPVTMAARAFYKVVVTDAALDSDESDVVGLEVQAATPAVGILGLGLLAGAFALGGAMVIRRREK